MQFSTKAQALLTLETSGTFTGEAGQDPALHIIIAGICTRIIDLKRLK
jgi:hypothetical protein